MSDPTMPGSLPEQGPAEAPPTVHLEETVLAHANQDPEASPRPQSCPFPRGAQADSHKDVGALRKRVEVGSRGHGTPESLTLGCHSQSPSPWPEVPPPTPSATHSHPLICVSPSAKFSGNIRLGGCSRERSWEQRAGRREAGWPRCRLWRLLAAQLSLTSSSNSASEEGGGKGEEGGGKREEGGGGGGGRGEGWGGGTKGGR